jgi:hypothetical protein
MRTFSHRRLVSTSPEVIRAALPSPQPVASSEMNYLLILEK